jgi:hypothetical protein
VPGDVGFDELLLRYVVGSGEYRCKSAVKKCKILTS